MTHAPPRNPSKEDRIRSRFQAELIFTGHRDVTVEEQEEYYARLAAANAKMKALEKEESIKVLGRIDGERVWLDESGWHAETPAMEEELQGLPTDIAEAVFSSGPRIPRRWTSTS